MKIIVSHFAKQHVNALLEGLDKKGGLVRFYTSIAANKWAFLPEIYPTIKKNWAKKQFNTEGGKIKHFPLVGILTFFIKNEYRLVRFIYQLFDKWVAKNLKNEEFDILIGYETCNYHSFKAAKKLGKTTILDLAAVHHDLQNQIFEQANIDRNAKHVAYISDYKNQTFAYTDYIFCLSDLAEKSLLEAGIPQNRIFKVHLGVNLHLFSPKKDYNKEKTLELYFVGRLIKTKGLTFLATVFEELLSRGRNMRLTFIGAPDNFIPPLSIKDHIRMIPFLSHAELVEMHHNLDILLLPTVLESWGQVVIEAMACGSPVLVSDNAGASEAIYKGGGEVLPYGDKKAWISALEKYDDNRYLLEKTGKKGIDIAQKYTWEAYHQQISDALDKIIENDEKFVKPLKLYHGNSI